MRRRMPTQVRVLHLPPSGLSEVTATLPSSLRSFRLKSAGATLPRNLADRLGRMRRRDSYIHSSASGGVSAMVSTLQATVPLVSVPARSSAAVAVGLASAGAFAISNALQHRAAGRLPDTVLRALAVLGHLARQRIWLAGTCISFCALLLHALALQFGSIALVQPLMLVGVVLAVPARAALEHKRPRWCEVRAVGVTVVGLGAFILSTNPQPSDAQATIPNAVVFVVGCFAVALSILRASRTCSPQTPGFRAALLGSGAGVMFGATAGLLKLLGTSATWQGGRLAPLLVFGLLAGAGVLGTAMN